MKLTENQRRILSRRAAWWAGGLFAVAVNFAAFTAWRLLDRDPEPTAPDQQPTLALIARGEYLTRAADCAACHSRPGRAPFSGGLAFKLPFGVIYSTNITADRETGIGAWSDDDVVRALHLGVARGGTHLYPAFPYTSYTQMTRDDAIAIKAYLFSLPAVHASAHPNSLIFPFNQRWAMTFWNLVFLDAHRFRADPNLSDRQNRGAYVVTALGHCGECHTPRNLGFAMEGNALLAGTLVNGWRAYNITADRTSGVGGWSDQELIDYLHTGHADGRGSAAGPMGEAVSYSLQFLSPDDLSAVVAYLRTVRPAVDAAGGVSSPTAFAGGETVQENALGRQIFEGNCTGCHLIDGSGRQTPYAALAGSASVQDPKGVNIIKVLLNGADARAVHPVVAMPNFAGGMTDDELAALANFTIAHFGGRAGQVTVQDIKRARLD
jgi:mono/diheme cytochrome c family protein